MPPGTGPPPWHAGLTLDVVVAAARKSVLHPFVAWMLPLSLLAGSTPPHHLSVRAAAAYALLLTLLAAAGWANQRIAFGRGAEVEDVQDEVVVITGGAGGLGLLIADFYRMRGAGVAVLDVKPMPDDGGSGVEYFKCDVGSAEEVAAVAKKIRSSVGIDCFRESTDVSSLEHQPY
jgi:NADPH:quinone reductase-like Zn-dependent oxidoreductase